MRDKNGKRSASEWLRNKHRCQWSASIHWSTKLTGRESLEKSIEHMFYIENHPSYHWRAVFDEQTRLSKTLLHFSLFSKRALHGVEERSLQRNKNGSAYTCARVFLFSLDWVTQFTRRCVFLDSSVLFFYSFHSRTVAISSASPRRLTSIANCSFLHCHRWL